VLNCASVPMPFTSPAVPFPAKVPTTYKGTVVGAGVGVNNADVVVVGVVGAEAEAEDDTVGVPDTEADTVAPAVADADVEGD
jgi:hypothetical protein